MGKTGKLLRPRCDTQICSAFCFACGRKTGRQYDARVDIERRLLAGWNWLNCFRGPQGIVLLEMLRCFFFFLQFERPFALKMRKTVLLDIFLLYTAESSSRRIPATGCQDMKFSEGNKFYSVSHAVNFSSLYFRFIYFCISRLFLFYYRLSIQVRRGRSGARDTDSIEENCVHGCGRETCRKGR